MRANYALIVFTCVMMAGTAVAGPFEVPINQSQSNLTFELCVSGTCDADTSSVSGTVTIALDSVDFPTEIWLHDVDLYLNENLNVLLSWGFLGSLEAWAEGVELHYADEGNPMGPVALAGSMFSFVDVPADLAGTLTYESSGVPCVALSGAGYPCNDSRNLANEGTQYGSIDGDVTTANRVVTLVTDIDVNSPLDPENPSLGYVHVYGTVTGSVFVPQPPGDVDGDGDVDVDDVERLVVALGGPDVLTPPAGVSQYHFDNSDLDLDGDADLHDFAELAVLYE